jgi:hypothetical protein
MKPRMAKYGKWHGTSLGDRDLFIRAEMQLSSKERKKNICSQSVLNYLCVKINKQILFSQSDISLVLKIISIQIYTVHPATFNSPSKFTFRD